MINTELDRYTGAVHKDKVQVITQIRVLYMPGSSPDRLPILVLPISNVSQEAEAFELALPTVTIESCARIQKWPSRYEVSLGY